MAQPTFEIEAVRDVRARRLKAVRRLPGLRLFVALNRRAAAEGWKLGMTRPRRQAMTLLQVSGLEENLPLAENGVA